MRESVVTKSDIFLVSGQSYTQQRQQGFRPRQDREPWPLSLPLDWAAVPYPGDTNWCTQLHQWRMTDPILRAYFAYPNPELLREALSFVLDWHRFHIAEGRQVDKISWGDGSTGIRALRIAFFLDATYSGQMDVSEQELVALHELCDEHARRLQVDADIAMNNHGLFQIFGLNLLCKVAGERAECTNGSAFATRKFAELLTNQFDEFGVHREHSPAYHFLVTGMLRTLAGDRHFHDADVAGVVARALDNDGWLLFPNGREAMIGDSTGAIRTTVPPPACLVTAYTDGRGILVGDLHKSGYAVVRSADDKSMMFVTGGFHGNAHKHADDLSFELFERGRMVFVDSGKFAYGDIRFQGRPMRSYVKSAAAHNTVSLLDTPFSFVALATKGSFLEKTEIGQDAAVVRGRIERPDLFSQARTFVYSPGRYVIIHDNLEAGRLRSFVSSLHCAPDLLPVVQPTGFELQLTDQARLGAIVFGADEVDARRGQLDPLLGWSSPSYGRTEPLTVVRAHRCARSATITWTLWFDEGWREAALSHALALRA